MMVLNPPATAETTRPNNPVMQQKSTLRRKRSKGTIVAYGNEIGPKQQSEAAAAAGSSSSSGEFAAGNSESNSGGASTALVGPISSNPSQQSSIVKDGGGASTASATTASSNAAASAAARPCHAGRLALMCAQNALKMGARTQLLLCPPGRTRHDVQTALRQRQRMRSSNSNNVMFRGSSSSRASIEGTGGGGSSSSLLLAGAAASGYFALEKMLGGSDRLVEYEAMEEDLLLSSSTASTSYDDDDDDDNDEARWASSGDEDEACDLDSMFSEDSHPLDDQERYLALTEPLFAPPTMEALASTRAAVLAAAAAAGGASGKEQQQQLLPFNRRKIRYFDEVSVSDAMVARSYLRNELIRSKKRTALLVTLGIRKVQVEARRRLRLERGEPIDDLVGAEKETPEERALLSGVQPFPAAMTPAMAAALLLESLSMNPTESVEGMAKCYDGIVSAGLAVLDAQAPDVATLSPRPDVNKPRPRRSEIMAALTPLLVTSLEQPSGEVILALAKLRRMCGTTRYQRRFVQRVAPALIRPPGAAMWCLRHQNDMEAIMAAAELIFDAAFDLFSKGWYERGRMMLADNKRALTLNTAAQQLRRLSSEPAMEGFVTMTFPAPHGNRRRLMAAGRKIDGTAAASEALTEWEVIAVDRQIRISISSVLSKDWSRTVIHSDIPKPHNRRATVSSGLKHHRMAGLPQTEMSPKSIASPRSPNKTYKTPQSPTMLPVPPSSTLEGVESAYNHQNSFHSSHSGGSSERAISPPPASLLPSSPPPPVQRSSSKEIDTKTPMTPPRSPKSPPRPPISDTVVRGTDPVPILAPLSPKRGKQGGKEVVGLTTPMQPVFTPLSPSASSVGTAGSGSGDLVPYKLSLASAQTGSPSSSSYRMLTSTAAERKRTVAACRALRAQIQRFEDAFIQLHGRPPKGATDRAPLATTYAQYREWKRAIRADAACRIQALFRGFSTRWKLLRMNDPRVKRVILKRAGRSRNAEAVMNQISIPVEIGQADDRASPSSTFVPSSTSASDSFSASSQSHAPQWATRIARRRTGDRESMITPRGTYSSAPTPSSTSPESAMSLGDLQARKRDLKQQLKQYDMNFARRHGRMPVKAEKEPIRHLYESYNALKSQITQMEQEGRHTTSPGTPSTPNSFPPPASPVAVQSSHALAGSQLRVSPTSGSESGGNSGGEESPLRLNQIPLRGSANRVKIPKAASPPLVAGPGTASSSVTSSSSTSTAPPISQDLASLKAEKSQLHQMLRSYEKDFFREHKRQVSSFADIKPVASQYRRYKEIKKAIAAFQESTR